MAEKPPLKKQNVPVPERMRSLPVDPRGYPVPVNVVRDRSGKPNFAANDESVRQKLFREDRCGICGGRLLRGRWSVGGPGSALHPDGVFLDPPMHYECARYAVQACPYLAMSAYGKSVSKIGPMSYGPSKAGISFNPTVFSNRPDLFLLVMYVGQKLSYDDQAVRSLKPKRPFRNIEYWRDGVQIGENEGRVAAERYLKEQDAIWKTERKRNLPQASAIS